MYIEKLELKGFTRITLNTIDHIVYTPTAPVQVIIGTNGCGKSSLLSELSPLPAVPSEYSNGGFKKIWITHDGRSYYLESVFKSSAHHSFVCDGEELNLGHTGKVQYELVLQHFGWSDELHELLTGRTKFTNMPPSKRRDWITRLASVDYSYATKVYNRLVTAERDTQGVLRHTSNRLSQETQKLKSLVVIDGVDERIAQLRLEVNALLTSLDPKAGDAQQLYNSLHRIEREIRTVAQAIMERNVTVPSDTAYVDLQDVTDHLESLRRNHDSAKQLLDRCTAEYADLDALATDLGQVGDELPENLDVVIEQARDELERQRGDLIQFKTIEHPHQVHQANAQILDQLVTLFTELPDNTDNQFTRERMDALYEQIRQLQGRIDQAGTRLVQINHRRSVIETARASTCPSCGYVWREGYSEQELAELSRWEQEHQANLTRDRATCDELRTQIARIEEVLAMYARLRGFMNSYPILKPLWDHLLSERLHAQQPSNAVGLFTRWATDVVTSSRIADLQARLDQLTLMQTRQADGNYNHLAQRREALTRDIESFTLDLRTLKQRIAEVERFRASAVGVLELRGKLEELGQSKRQSLEALVSATRNTSINRIVYQHQDELATIQRQASERQAVEGIVNDLEMTRQHATLRQKAYALLAEAISPTEGLIADDMAAFIQCLVDQMNSIIEAIWTYDLLIQPCSMESGELNYKFPLYSSNMVKDVALGSDSQIDVVNFAFRLAVMLYLNISDVPLFMDEPAITFDEQHRINMMTFVKQLMDSHQHPQLFMVSHYSASHGSFSNAQTLVLSAFNIATPEHYNDHVTFA